MAGISGADKLRLLTTGEQLGKYAGVNFLGNSLGTIDDRLGLAAQVGDAIYDMYDNASHIKGLAKYGKIPRKFIKGGLPILAADLAGSAMGLAGTAYAMDTQRRMKLMARLGNLLGKDQNIDYNMRKALFDHPEWLMNEGHFQDTYKKSNHPTFSRDSKYWIPAMQYAYEHGKIKKATYEKITDPEFNNWYTDEDGKEHYIPMLYQVNDPKWQARMERDYGEDVIIDDPISGGLLTPLDYVFGDEDIVDFDGNLFENIGRRAGILNGSFTDFLKDYSLPEGYQDFIDTVEPIL